ncbi:helix-turn-helix domain-containing protein [Nonomuraea polychroma]|uniref:helix-turn-helix domain-containing protein n=1 Tax=Nonomuraea polychroma TaxID=46176 RepID=UPI003D918EB0
MTDRPRCGRPPTFSPLQRAEIKALACQLPAETGVPLSCWSCPELAREAVTRGLAAAISASTVRRILAEDALKPWQAFPPCEAGTDRHWRGAPGIGSTRPDQRAPASRDRRQRR